MLSIQNVSFSYTKTTPILTDISLSVNQGEYIALLGESGCGKSTLLEIIYGLMDLKQGEIHYHDKRLLGPKFNIIPGHPFMKYLAQDFSLMPFTTVAENVGEFLSNIYKDKKNARVKELLEVVDMSDFAHTMVKNLSGGQKQRVAIARVLAKEPEVLLLDEPFSHIDNFRKNHLRRRLFKFLKEQKITCVVATHDSTDALSFADKIHIIRDTKIIRSGSPIEIYTHPTSTYIASFFNEVNEIPYKTLNIDKEGNAILYPEQLNIVEASSIEATVVNSYFKGASYLIEMQLNGLAIVVSSNREYTQGTVVNLSL